MIKNLFKRMDCPTDSPFFTCRKCGSAISGMINSMNQEQINNQNYRMNQENNELQQQLVREANEMQQNQFEQSLAWLREQFNVSNEREDSKYQRTVDDLMRAGLNPSLMSGISPSSVSSVGAPSQSNFHVAQTEAAHFDPYYLDFDPLQDGITKSIASYYQNKKAKAETENIQTDSQTKMLENWTKLQRDTAEYFRTMAETDKILADKDVSQATKDLIIQQRENAKQEFDLLKEQFNDLAVKPKKENRILDSQAENIDSQTVLNVIESRLRPALANAQISLSSAQAKSVLALIRPQVLNLLAERNEHRAKTALLSKQEIAQKIQNSLDKIDLKEKQRLFGEYDSSTIGRMMKDFSMELGDLLVGPLRDLIKFK